MEKIEKYSKFFEKKYMNPKAISTGFYCLSDESPKDLKTLILKIHREFDSWPNDWIYKTILEAFRELEENDNDMDSIEIEADIYNSDRYEWLGNHFAYECCDEALVNGLCEGVNNISDIIVSGQWLAKDRIYRLVHEFLNEKESELDE